MTGSHPIESAPHWQSIEEVDAYNQNAVRELAWVLENTVGEFALILVHCNYAALREAMVQWLHDTCPVEIRTFVLKRTAQTLYSEIRKELRDERPKALTVFGLESARDLDQVLLATNQIREEFRKNLPFPLVLWVNDDVLKKLIRLAPDFYSWSTQVKFVLANSQLVNALDQGKIQLLNSILEVGGGQFLPNEFIFGSSYQPELESALKDLRSRGQALTPEVQATLDFALGRDDYVRNQLKTAVDHYQKSLDFWKQTGQLEWQGILLCHMGLCYLRQAEYYGAADRRWYWEEASRYFQSAIERFEQAQQPELVARFINQLGEVLKHLEAWEALSDLAQKSLVLQKTDPNPRRTAQAYGFLAEVALQQSRWQDAKQTAQQSLDLILPTPADQQPEQSLYRLLLARSLQALGQPAKAIAHLKKARALGPQDDPQLYTRILEALRVLYFEQKYYLEAFRAKQEQRSIEQQYGLRAFIGAGRLKPQRQDRSSLGRVERQDMVAQEISASGRQQDIHRLIQRIGSTQHRLTVLYGQSGVGKSSMLEAGLIPTLRQAPIGDRDVAPVLLRMYTRWVKDLGKALTAALDDLPVGHKPATDCKSPAAILEQLRRNEQHYLLTVLILDQFEEFFFTGKTPSERQHFFEFLRDCLDIPFVKVILSIREDYLHHLLEGSRRVKLDVINNNILDKHILYHIGNFSPQDAQSIIQSLTQRSQVYLEPALVDALVTDLASDGEEVRPIELQVVGAQLQTEKIATLAQYQEHGPKEKLVQKYLAEVVTDCGPENQRLARLVLYFLTAENNTRPLKTRGELEKDLEPVTPDLLAAAKQLDLVLRIFVESGLVFLLPETPDDRYQLVHDYLVIFIRQQEEPELKALTVALEKERQQRKLSEEELNKFKELVAALEQEKKLSEEELNKFKELVAALEQEKKQRKRSEEQRKRSKEQLNRVLKQRLRISIATGFGLAILTGLTGIFALQSDFHRKEAEISEIEATNAYSEELWTFNQDFEALMTSLKALDTLRQIRASRILRLMPNQQSKFEELQSKAEEVLQKSVYRVSERNRLDGHQETVFEAAFSPDGQTIATASGDNTVKLWSQDGQELRTLESHDDFVSSVSFSPDGQTIATASFDQTVKLWNLDGQELRTLIGHDETVHSVRFSPDGQTLATASEDGTAKLWGLDGQELRTLTGHNAPVLEVTFSPDGQTLATASFDQTAKLWTIEGQELQTLTGHKDAVFSVSFSSDGQTIATGGGRLDRTAKLWNLDGQELQTLTGHNNTVTSVRFRPDSKTLVTTSADETVKVWGTDGQHLQTLTGHNSWVWSVAFSPDGQTLATASADNTVKLWRLNPQTILGHKGVVHDVSFSLDGQTLATAGGDNTVKLWNVNAQYLRSLLGHTDEVNAVSFSPVAPIIATASNDKTVKLWNLEGQALQTLSGHEELIVDVSFSPDGRTLATASKDNTAILWSLDGQALQTLTGHNDEVRAVSFSPDGQTLATAGYDGTAKLWNLQGEELATLTGHEGLVTDISFSPDGQTLATASYDGAAKLWNLEGQELNTLRYDGRTLSAVSFSPDGQTIATASWDQTIKLWNLQGKALDTLHGHTDKVSSLNFSPDGRFIASADESGRVIMWNLAWDLDELRAQGCDWIRDYLENNPEVGEGDRTICDGIGAQ